MTETLSEDAQQSPQAEQLFHMHPGAYPDTHADVIEIPDTPGPEPQASEVVAPPAEAKRRKIKDMGGTEMLEVALEGRLPEHVAGIDDPRRDAFVRKYAWAVGSELEMTAAIGMDRFENPPLVQYILGAKDKNDGGIYAIDNVVNAVDRIRREAKEAIEELDKAFHPSTREFLPGVIKDDPHVRKALAEEILAINSLNLADWPRRIISKKGPNTVRSKTFDDRFEQIENIVAQLPAEQAEVLCRRTLERQRQRLGFWADQYEKAAEHEDTKDLLATVKPHGRSY